MTIWQETVSPDGTATEHYLRIRNIIISIPQTIRHHPGLVHRPAGLTFSAMVVAVQDGIGQIVAIHRTYLLPDGSGKAQVSSPKMTLGSLEDGAVRLDTSAPALALTEGVETGLSVQQIFEIPCWCALESRLERMSLPDQVIEVQIFGDNGKAGRTAAEKAAKKFLAEGRRVFLRFPPPEYADWNDVLTEKVAA